ncbi:hypothetical protein M1328_01000 [Patescibacteria group bacterium]|nr:hypothetical protein [Patescibacteria group bacterium]
MNRGNKLRRRRQSAMKRKTDKDILEVISNFQRFLDHKPPLKKMYEEIQMMKFKVKPIKGDLSTVDLKNEKFIATLWSLGKLDEFFQKEYDKLTPKNRELFSRVFDSIYHKYQQELNKVSLHFEKPSRETNFLEVEIFKEKQTKKVN